MTKATILGHIPSKHIGGDHDLTTDNDMKGLLYIRTLFRKKKHDKYDKFVG
jgi:hypothetical protein